jgi:hypothetical protein
MPKTWSFVEKVQNGALKESEEQIKTSPNNAIPNLKEVPPYYF